MAKHPEILHEEREIVYSQEMWNHLSRLRRAAKSVMSKLNCAEIDSVVYGSVVRGDVSRASDVDIFIPFEVPSYRVEIAVGQNVRRELVQATPSSVLKAHIHISEKTVVSFPMFKMMSREWEFYVWGGIANLQMLEAEKRVMGVDKRLLLIEPTEYGHRESGVIGYEALVAKKLGVSLDIARERVRVLTRRDAVGRTGVYISRELAEDESFEAVAKSLTDRNPALRRTVHRRMGR